MKFEALVDNVRGLCHTIYSDDHNFFKGGCLYKHGVYLENILGLDGLDFDIYRFDNEWQRYDLENDVTLMITLKDGSWYFILDGTPELDMSL